MQIQNLIKNKLNQVFYDNLPHSLYLNAYELSKQFGGTADDWKSFMKDPEVSRFIESEIASLAEVAARRALQSLANGSANSADIQAAKELLANSKLLKSKMSQKQNIVLTYLPQRSEE